MKLSLIAAFAISILFSCNSSHKKQKSNASHLFYNEADTTAGDLSAQVDLDGNIKTDEVTAQIRLSNSGAAAISFQEAGISTPEGIRSTPSSGFEPFSLSASKDTTLAIKFSPVNDLKLYQATGLTGSFKGVYMVSLGYKAPGNDNQTSLVLKPAADKAEFADYCKTGNEPLTGYLFNTKNGFNARETKYLVRLMQASRSPFVYLSEQEIAVAGLNFRLKTYTQLDTIHAELYVINHADFPVKFIADSLNILADNQPASGGNGIVKFEKISGSQSDANMMEKGDRLLIHYKKFIAAPSVAPTTLVLHIKSAFVLSGPKNLFDEDVELLPLQFR